MNFIPCGILGYVLEKNDCMVYEYMFQDFLMINAFLQAYKKEHPKTGLIIHTDQGS